MDINEKIWMVKSSGRLIGPCSLSEVVVYLQQQSLSVIDEIRPPSERWLFIREQSLVMSILKELGGPRKKDHLSEVTNTNEHTLTQTLTETVTITESVTAGETVTTTVTRTTEKKTDREGETAVETDVRIEAGRKAESESSIERGLKRATALESQKGLENPIHGKEEEEFTLTPESTIAANQAYQKVILARERELSGYHNVQGSPSYGSAYDLKFQQKVQEKKTFHRYVLFGSIFLFFVMISLVFLYESHRQKEAMTLQAKKLNIAREKLSFGQNQEAFDVYDKVYAFSPALFSIQDTLNYVLLLFKVSNRWATGEGLLSQIPKPESLTHWRLWMMSKLYLSFEKKFWDEAQLILNELKQAFPHDEEIFLAEAQKYWLSGKLKEAVFLLEQYLIKFKNSVFYQDQAKLLLAQIFLSDSEIQNKPGLKTQILELLKTQGANFEPYYLQKNILLAAIHLEAQPFEAKEIIKNLWAVNIFDQGHFVLSLTGFPKGLDWPSFLPLCLELTQVLSPLDTDSDSYSDSGSVLSSQTQTPAQFQSRAQGQSQQEREPLVYLEDSATALGSLCLFFSGQKAEAYKKLSLARKQRPSSSILTSVEAHLFLSEGREAEASARVSLCGNTPSCYLARMRQCFAKEDDQCLSQVLAQTSPERVGPYYYLASAQVAKKRGNDFSYKDHILKGLQSYPNYQPLMLKRP
jgi:hypothetical protein